MQLQLQQVDLHHLLLETLHQVVGVLGHGPVEAEPLVRGAALQVLHGAPGVLHVPLHPPQLRLPRSVHLLQRLQLSLKPPFQASDRRQALWVVEAGLLLPVLVSPPASAAAAVVAGFTA